MEALRADWRTAPITDAERVMIEYVIQLTEHATRISPDKLPPPARQGT